MPYDAEALCRRSEALVNARSNFSSFYQLIAEVAWPDAAQFTTIQTPGTKRTQKVFDSTATNALERFAGFFMAWNTPPTQTWQTFRPEDDELEDDAETMQWLDDLGATLFEMRNAPRSGFEGSLHEVYKSLGAFGTGCMFIDGKRTGGITYRCIPLSEIYIAQDYEGQVDTVFRKYQLEARSVMQRWGKTTLPGGKAMPEHVVKMAEKEPDALLSFLKCVMPRADFDPGRADERGKPWVAVEILTDDKIIMEEGGYEEMPYVVPRYTVNAGEVYGRSPTMLAFPDIMTLQDMAKTFLKSGHRAVDPPLLLADDNVMGAGQRPDLRPGGNNYGMIDENGRPKMLPFISGARLDLSFEMMASMKQSINDALMTSLAQILAEHPNMTATEVLIRQQEKGQIMTPVIGRIRAELLDPMTEREASLCIRQGRIRPMPMQFAETEGAYKMLYQSEATRMQRSDVLMGVQRYFQVMAPIAATRPTIYEETLNVYELGKLAMDIETLPQKIRLSDEQRAAMTQMRLEEQERAQMLEAAPALAGGLKDVAEASRTLGEVQGVA